MTITIVGLGPGNPDLLTREAWEVLSRAGEVYLRTSQHPTAEGLPAGLAVRTFDSVYQDSDDFDDVYGSIVERVLELGQRPGGVVYCVPGHPLVGEATVTGLLEKAAAAGLGVRIVNGLSFVEPVLTALLVDGMAGLQVVDALDVALSLHPPLNPDAPALLGQLYSKELAGDVKLTLMNEYPEEHQVHLIHSAGNSDQHVELIPLYALDHSHRISHLTALYVPALPRISGLERFQDTVAQLRGPDGCPWDQEQTHQSLARGLIEETAEVVEALDADDMPALCEELGDLLLHLAMQTQLAAEDGDFTMADVIAGIDSKLRRRHPHVFGGEHVSGVAQVLVNWDEIKQRERHTEKDAQLFEGIPASLSALAQADAHLSMAVKAGIGWSRLEGGVGSVGRVVEAAASAGDADETAKALGELLLSSVEFARRTGVDAQAALRLATRRFRDAILSEQGANPGRAGGIDQPGRDDLASRWGADPADREADGD